MHSNLDISEYWCPNRECSDHGKKGKGNIIPKEKYGNEDRWLLKCKTCGHCFSETRGTIFFGLMTPKEEVLRILAMIPEKGSIRGTARDTGHDKSSDR